MKLEVHSQRAAEGTTLQGQPPEKPVENPTSLPPIVRTLPAITRAHVEAFAQATRSEHYVDCPPTYPTTFRSTEFEWIGILGIDLHNLLHTEQEYEYLKPLREGDIPLVASRVTEYRERRGLLFVEVTSDVTVAGDVVLIARSSFVVRSGESA